MKKHYEIEPLSHPGGREANEDYYDFHLEGQSGCWVVADGLGGHRAGETASRLAVEAMIETFRERPVCAPETIVEGLNAAQRELIRQQNENPDLYGMRTTAVVLVADKGVALWGHVGDSRLYRFQDGALVHQTPDHSVTQALRDAGQIGRQQMRGDENRGRLTRVLGTESSPAEPEVEETPQPLAADEAFLLCTDGFWEHVEEEEMAIDLSKSRSPKQWLRLMEARLRSRAEGEYDNYTAVAVFCHTGQGKGLAAVPSPVAARTDRPSPKPSGGVQRRWASELSTSRRRRSPWTALLAALGVCAAALFAVYWFLLRPPPESNRPPQAVKDVVDTKDREPVKIPVLKNDRDADEDELLLASVESPQHGEVTWNEEGILTYTPHEGFSGRERFAYEVTDREAVSEGEVEVRVAATSTDRNHAPEPEDDLARVEPGTVVAILVLGNDWDRDGDELRLEAVGEPLHGQVYARPDGRVAYSSPEEFEGPDEFTYVVTDGELTAEAVVRVEVRAPTPVNRRPTTQGDQAEATSGQAVKIDVLGNDSDPDGDTLELAGVTAPQHGTAALNAEGTVTYTSKQGFEGTDRFTYLVTDGSLQNSAEVVVEVKPIDAAPDDGPPEGQGATPGDPAGEAPAPPPPAPPPEPPPPPQAGEIRTNGEGGLEYVWIPASPKGFWLGRTEVTIAAYRRHSPTPGAQPPNSTGQHPVVAVKWADADVFCRSTGGRLPTAAEWVYAAQGGQDGLKYPWGEENPVCAVGARTGATFKSCNTGGPQPIKTYTAHGFELYDMAGNVAEWCQDDARWGTKAVHGGSWKDSRSDIQASAEDRKAPDKAFDDVGFRCARDEAPRPVEDE